MIWFDRIRVARVLLMRSSPIISFFVEELTIVSAATIPQCGIDTAGVSKSGICVFNESFVETLTDPELNFVVAHEALHWGLGLFDRIGYRDLFLSNIAHDFVVNGILSVIGHPLTMPENVLFERAFLDLSFEQLYEKLESQPKKFQSMKGVKLSGTNSGLPAYDCTCSDSIDSAYDDHFAGTALENNSSDSVSRSLATVLGDSQSNRYEISEKRRQLALSKTMDSIRTAQGSKGRGWGCHSEFNASFELVKKVKEPTPKLFEEVPRMIGHYGKRSQPSQRRRNHRNRFDGTHLPYSGLRPSLSTLYLLVDTSGSMWRDTTAIETALGLILRLVLDQQMELVIVQCDAIVQSTESGMETVSKIIRGELELYGQGGSDFRPAFDWMENHAKRFNDSKMPVVAFTDGGIDVPEKISGVCADILWVGSAPTTEYGRLCVL